MAFAGWSGDGVHYIALLSAVAIRSLWCIPSSLHFFFFHSVARIGLHRDGTGYGLRCRTFDFHPLNQVLWYARALKHPHPHHAMQLAGPIRLVRVADLGCPLDARRDKIFVPKMTHTIFSMYSSALDLQRNCSRREKHADSCHVLTSVGLQRAQCAGRDCESSRNDQKLRTTASEKTSKVHVKFACSSVTRVNALQLCHSQFPLFLLCVSVLRRSTPFRHCRVASDSLLYERIGAVKRSVRKPSNRLRPGSRINCLKTLRLTACPHLTRLHKWHKCSRIEGGHAVGPIVGTQSDQLLDHTQIEGFGTFNPTARSSHSATVSARSSAAQHT
ncbi:hypothetical protein C8R45DRAFT_941167 [Mycena sanguinolenta]|nr:hypothetical protein C8R45DRAFT_941167 [Mycena sanguinolenta]